MDEELIGERIPDPGQVFSAPEGDAAGEWVDAFGDAAKRMLDDPQFEIAPELRALLWHTLMSYGKRVWRGTRRKAAADAASVGFPFDFQPDVTNQEAAIYARDEIVNRLRG